MKMHIKIVSVMLVCATFLFAVPEVGKPAPDFTIYRLDTKDYFTLSDVRTEKVVLLISGNLC